MYGNENEMNTMATFNVSNNRHGIKGHIHNP